MEAPNLSVEFGPNSNDLIEFNTLVIQTSSQTNDLFNNSRTHQELDVDHFILRQYTSSEAVKSLISPVGAAMFDAFCVGATFGPDIKEELFAIAQIGPMSSGAKSAFYDAVKIAATLKEANIESAQKATILSERVDQALAVSRSDFDTAVLTAYIIGETIQQVHLSAKYLTSLNDIARF